MDQKQQNQNSVIRPGEPRSEKSGHQNLANIAGEQCHPAVTGGVNTVTTHVGQQPTEPDSASQNDPAVTLANSSRDATGNRDENVTVIICQQCGCEMLAKRPSKKFCSNRCRQAAWLSRHPDVAEAKAAAWRERTRQRIEARGGEWIERA